MAKVSPVYRGTPADDPKGFQPEAIGNYVAKSDVADLDNVYLSDQGWVYRHFKPRADDPEAYWDEIIWAGDVSGPGPANDATPTLVPATPEANDPVGIFGAESQTFQSPPLDPLGDGIQFVTGPYPSSSSTIGTVRLNSDDTVDATQAIPFTLLVGGTLANTDTYKWEVTGPATATFSAGTQTGTFTGNTPAQGNVSITFPEKGSYTVKCTLTSVSGDGLESEGVKQVGVEEHIAQPVLGTVKVTGNASPQAGIGIQYTVNVEGGTATDSDITGRTWTAVLKSDGSTTAPNVQITQPDPDGDKATAKVVFQAATACVETLIKCSVAATTASNTPQVGQLEVLPHTVIGDGTVAGGNTTVAKDAATAAYSVTFTGASNPAPNDLVYAWTSDIAGSFSSASSATPTFTPTAAGTGEVKCTVTSANAEPGTSICTAKALTVTE